jgi:cobalt-zinc-cadmium efflux system membrane fusion protein
LILAALAGLGAWGVYNDWQLPTQRSERDKQDGRGDKADAGDRSSDPAPRMRVELASAEAVRRAGIRVTPAEVRTLAQYVTANGMVDYEPSRYARLTARAAGTVWRVFKQIGDPIYKGETLALVDAAEVGRAKADFLQSLVQLRLRQNRSQRLRDLGGEGVVSETALRDAEANLSEARIRAFNAHQALLNLGLPIRIDDVKGLTEEDMVKHMRCLGLPEALQQQVNAETLTATLLPVTAPFDGQVVERNAAKGEVVQLNQPQVLFVVADLSQLHVDLDVNPEDMAGVRVGQPILFRCGDGPEAPGEVSHISPEVDPKTRRVRVHAEIPNPERRLRPNSFGTGRIRVGERTHAVVVPLDAVQTDGGNSLVFVRVSETTFAARPVRPGLRQGDVVEVSGVQAGEEVVTTGSFVLRSELQKERIAGGD